MLWGRRVRKFVAEIERKCARWFAQDLLILRKNVTTDDAQESSPHRPDRPIAILDYRQYSHFTL